MKNLSKSTRASHVGRILTLFTFILSTSLLTGQPAFASPQADVTDNQKVIAKAFPQFTSIRSSSADFAEAAGKVYLSDSQSYGIVNFLIEDYGQNKTTELLTHLWSGSPIDNALVTVSGAPIANQVSTPTPIQTSSFEEQSTDESSVRGRPPLSLTLTLLGFCCIFILIIGVISLGLFVRRENRKGGDNE